MRRTKIVCTVGPATESKERLRAIVEAGADVLRLNFSHGTSREHAATVVRIRDVAAELAKPVAILQDLPGPKLRVGEIPDGPVQLETGGSYTITTRPVSGNAERASVDYQGLAEALQPGEQLLLADGTIDLVVESIDGPDIRCRVVHGGALSSHKGLSVPRGAVRLAAFTEKDKTLLGAGLEMGVDLAALSFVRTVEDVAAARRFLVARRASLPLMAKIEKSEAVDAIDDIIDAVDAVMLARGDLGVEVSPADVPLIQKDVIAQVVRAAKPVVTATQMLRSMVTSPRPTRAEAADVANAVLDGSDALMLSEETAIGEYPVESVRMLVAIAERAEERLVSDNRFSRLFQTAPLAPSEALAHAACLVAFEAGAAGIVCFTRSGRTAQLVARYRPSVPIIAVSPDERTVRRLMLAWGVSPVLSDRYESTDQLVTAAVEAARSSRHVPAGSRVVIVAGAPTAGSGSTDFVRVASVPP